MTQSGASTGVRRPLDAAAMTRVVGLCLLWGFQQVAMKFVAGEIDTVLQVALRSAVAALLVWLYSRFWRRDAWVRGPAT